MVNNIKPIAQQTKAQSSLLLEISLLRDLEIRTWKSWVDRLLPEAKVLWSFCSVIFRMTMPSHVLKMDAPHYQVPIIASDARGQRPRSFLSVCLSYQREK